MTISNIRRVERIGSSPSAWLYTGEGDPTSGDGLQGDEGSLLVTTFDEIVYRKTGPDPVDWSPFTALPGPPSGDAGGVLDGTYPNPTFADSPEFSGGLTVLDGTTDVQALTAHGLIQALASLTVAAAMTLTLTGANVAGAPSWGSTQSLNTSGNAGTATALQTARAIYGNNFDGTSPLTSTIVTIYGGTGLSSWTGGDVPFYVSGTALSKLGIGAANRVLTSSGSAPQWSASLTGIDTTGNAATATALATPRAIYGNNFDGTAALTSAIVTTYGGTGVSSWTGGDLPYYTSGTALSKLGIGAANRVLTSSGSVPQWVASLTGVDTTGNAATATALQNARTIGGVSFDGTANITVSSATGGFTVSGGTLSSAAFTSTGTATFSNSVAGVAIYGWSPHGGTSTNHGTFKLGNGASSGFRLDHDDSSNTITYFDNVWDDAGALMKFRFRTAASAIIALTLSGAGNATVAGLGTFNGGLTVASGQTMTLTGVTVVGFTATTANTLSTPRTIWGQSFDGSANVSGAITGATTISNSGAQTNTLAGTALIFTPASTSYAAIRFNLTGGSSGGFLAVDNGQSVVTGSSDGDMVLRADATGAIRFASTTTLRATISGSGLVMNSLPISGVSYFTFNGAQPGGLGASRGVLDFSGGAARWFTYGANGSTNGTFIINSQRSDGSNSIDLLTSDTSGNVLPGSDNSKSFGSGSARWLNIFASQYFVGNALNMTDYSHGDLLGGSTDIRLRNNANNANNIVVADAGTVTISRGQLIANASATDGLTVYGYSPHGGANNAHGSIKLGNSSSSGFRIDHDDSSNTITYFDNLWDSASALIKFRLRASSTPVFPVVMMGTGDIQVGGGTIADAGVIRLANAKNLAWRNAGDTTNMTLGLDSSDRFVFSGGAPVWIKGTGGQLSMEFHNTTASAANAVFSAVTGGSELKESTSSRAAKNSIRPLSNREADRIVLEGEAAVFRSSLPGDDPLRWHLGFILEDVQQLNQWLIYGRSLAYERFTAPLVVVAQRHDYELKLLRSQFQQMAERFQEHQSWLQQIELWKDDTDGRLDQLEDRVSRLEQAA